MINKYLLVGLLFVQVHVFAQSPKDYAELITPEDLKDNLSIIASDALEGRATGTRGQKMAAAFISFHFQQLGLKAPVNGSYYQPFELYRLVPGETTITAGGVTYRNFQDIVFYGQDNTSGSIPVVFAGRGRAQDFANVQVAGKGVVLLMSEDAQDYQAPIAEARNRNAAAIFIVNTKTQEQFKGYARQWESFLTETRPSLKKPEPSGNNSGVFFIAPAVAEKILNTSIAKLNAAATSTSKSALRKAGTGNVSYRSSVEVQTIHTENVLGFLEGSDKKDEVVVITSHYDHIGKKSSGVGDLINNGADDDGSGTVAVMQLAKAFAQAKKDGHGPRRSILFMTVAAEEVGLLGSEYYTQYPVFPLDNTVVNLNLDMIGRRDEEHKDSPPYVYVIGSDKLSSELHALSESINKKYTNLVFDYTYNDESHPARLYYRSDHWNFARKDIPIIFYFDGIHEDYHLPSDEVDKIEFDLLTLRTKCVFYTAWEIVNRNQRIVPDAK